MDDAARQPTSGQTDMKLMPRFSVLVITGLLAAPAAAQPETSPSHPEAIRLYNSAVEFQNQGLFGLAVDEWKDLLGKFGDDPLAPKAGYYLGTCYFQTGDYMSAAQAFSDVVQKHPKFEQRSAAMANLGLAQFNAGEHAQAAKAFTQHLAQFADDPLAAQSRFYLAESQYSLGEKAMSLAGYKDWLAKHAGGELEPQVILALAATAVELNQPRDAIDPLRKLLGNDPDEPTQGAARLRLGEAYLGLGQAAEARDELLKAAAFDFADADYAQQQAGTASYQLGEIAAAAKHYAQVAERFPQSPLAAESLVLAARCAVESGDAAAALRYAAQASQAGAAGAELAHWKIRAQIEAGDLETALHSCENALNEQLSAAERQLLLLDKADALYASDGQRSESLAIYRQAAAGDHDPVVAAHALHLGAATALELGKLAEAQQLADSYRQRFPQGIDLADTLQVLAEAQLQQADAKSAAATYQSLIEAAEDGDPRRDEWIVRYGWALFTSEDYERVAQVLATLASGDRAQSAEAAYLLGRSHFQLEQYKPAIAALTKSSAGDSSFAEESLLLVGQSQQALGQTEQALATFATGVERFGDGKLTDRFLYRRGEAAADAGEWQIANASFDQLLQRFASSPLAPYAVYRKARIAAAHGNHQAAADLLASFAAEYADHPLLGSVVFVRAGSLQQLGKHDDALRVLSSLDASAVDSKRLAYSKAVSLAGVGRNAEAAAELERLRKAAPDYFVDRVLYELAFAYKNNNESDKALATFAALTQAAPGSPLAAEGEFRQGEILYDRDEFATAAERFAAACNDMADASLKSQARHLEGWAQLKAKQYKAAATAWQAQLAIGQQDDLATDARWLVGEAQFQAEQFADALKTFNTAGENLPTAPGLAPLVILHAGQAAGQAGEWQASHDWLERLRSEYPDYAGRNQGIYELAVALQNLDKIDEAEQVFASVASSDNTPLAYRARFMEGEMQFAAKDYQQAVRTFFRVFAGASNADLGDEYHTWQAESMFEAARCLEQLDRGEAARKLYADLVTRFPQHPKAELARKQLGQ